MLYVVIAVGALVSVLALALIGLITTVRFLLMRRSRQGAYYTKTLLGVIPLGRTEKLKIAKEVLGEEFPNELEQELSYLQGISTRPTLQNPPSEPTPTRNESSAFEMNPKSNDIDMADSGIGDGFIPIDSRPLAVDPQVASLTKKSSSVLASFISFENIFFLLSATLILGGTLYFAAASWEKVPGDWQYLYLEGVILFYGTLMLVGTYVLVERFQLFNAGKVLAAIASVVGILCSVVASASYDKAFQAGMVGTFLVSGFVFLAVRVLLKWLDLEEHRAIFMALAAGLLSITGLLNSVGSDALSGLVLLLASGLACFWYAPTNQPPKVLHLFLVPVVPLTGALLSIPGHVSFYATLPSVSLLVYLGLAFRQSGHSWVGPVGTIVASCVFLMSLGSPGAMVATSLIGCLALGYTSTPVVDVVSNAKEEVLGMGPKPLPCLWTAIAAGALWCVFAIVWAPGLGTILPLSLKTWLIELIRTPGQQIAASWDGLAALPCIVAALAWSRKTPLADSRRLVAEISAWTIVGLISLMTLLTITRQPFVSGVILALSALLFYAWSWFRGSSWRMIGSHLVALLAVFCLAYSFSKEYAFFATAVFSTGLLASGRIDGRMVGGLLTPPLVLAALSHISTPPSLLLGLYGVLALVQPFSDKPMRWLRPCGPLSILCSMLLVVYYTQGAHAWTDNGHYLSVLIAGLMMGTAWLLRYRGPRFLYLEVTSINVLAIVLGIVATLPNIPGTANGILFASQTIFLWVILVVAQHSGTLWAQVCAWGAAAWGIPISVAWFGGVQSTNPPLDLMAFSWPGGVVAAAGSLTLCRLCFLKKEFVPYRQSLVTSGLVEGAVAVIWLTLIMGASCPLVKSAELILPGLAITLGAYAVAVVLQAKRFTGASDTLIWKLCCTLLAVMFLVCFAGILLDGEAEAIDIGLTTAALTIIGGFSVLLALRHKKGWPIYVAHTSVVLVYTYLRVRTNLLAGLADYDGLALVAGSLLFMAISRFLENHKRTLGVAENRRAAAVLPLMVPLCLEWDGLWSESFALLIGGMVYVLLTRYTNSMRSGWIAAIFLNLMLVPIWVRYDITHPTAVFLPAGLTLILLTRIYQERLKELGPKIRTIGALLVLGSTSWESLSFDSLWPALALAFLSCGAIVLGVAWRMRSYLYLGFTFLVLDITLNLTHWGMKDRLLAGGLGVLAGIGLFVVGVMIARHKESLLQRYRDVQRWDW